MQILITGCAGFIGARESLTGLDLTLLVPFTIVTACSLIATFIGLVGFRIAMPHLIARMGGWA